MPKDKTKRRTKPSSAGVSEAKKPSKQQSHRKPARAYVPAVDLPRNVTRMKPGEGSLERTEILCHLQKISGAAGRMAEGECRDLVLAFYSAAHSAFVHWDENHFDAFISSARPFEEWRVLFEVRHAMSQDSDRGDLLFAKTRFFQIFGYL